MIRGSRTEKGTLRGKILARCIPKRLFAGLFGRMVRISCQNQLISDTWRRNVATSRRFSRPRPLRERMRRKLPLLTARERTAAIFWHRHDVREYTASICCHGPGAAGEGRSGAQRYLRGWGLNRWKSTRLKSAALSTRGSGLESLAACGLQRATLFCASVRPCVYASVRLCDEWGFRPLEPNCWERL